MRDSRTTFIARSSADLVALAPQVLGFHPHDSVVLMTFGAGDSFHARVDLPGGADDQLEVVDMLREVISRHRVRRVALLLYTDDPWLAATFHDAAVPRLRGDRVEVIDVLRVARGRFHDASDPRDPGKACDLRAHRFTAEQVVRGRVVHGSREQLAATLRLVDAADARAVADSAARVDFGDDLVAQARWIQRTVRRHARRGTRVPADVAGKLLALVSRDDLRDVAWAQLSRRDAGAHVELWRDLVRRCPATLLPSASCLLAFAAWLHGDGALAWCALDRCDEVDPGYPMAACLRDLLHGAVPPSAWTPIDERDLRAFWPSGPDAS